MAAPSKDTLGIDSALLAVPDGSLVTPRRRQLTPRNCYAHVESIVARECRAVDITRVTSGTHASNRLYYDQSNRKRGRIKSLDEGVGVSEAVRAALEHKDVQIPLSARNQKPRRSISLHDSLLSARNGKPLQDQEQPAAEKQVSNIGFRRASYSEARNLLSTDVPEPESGLSRGRKAMQALFEGTRKAVRKRNMISMWVSDVTKNRLDEEEPEEEAPQEDDAAEKIMCLFTHLKSDLDGLGKDNGMLKENVDQIISSLKEMEEKFSKLRILAMSALDGLPELSAKIDATVDQAAECINRFELHISDTQDWLQEMNKQYKVVKMAPVDEDGEAVRGGPRESLTDFAAAADELVARDRSSVISMKDASALRRADRRATRKKTLMEKTYSVPTHCLERNEERMQHTNSVSEEKRKRIEEMLEGDAGASRKSKRVATCKLKPKFVEEESLDWLERDLCARPVKILQEIIGDYADVFVALGKPVPEYHAQVKCLAAEFDEQFADDVEESDEDGSFDGADDYNPTLLPSINIIGGVQTAVAQPPTEAEPEADDADSPTGAVHTQFGIIRVGLPCAAPDEAAASKTPGAPGESPEGNSQAAADGAERTRPPVVVKPLQLPTQSSNLDPFAVVGVSLSGRRGLAKDNSRGQFVRDTDQARVPSESTPTPGEAAQQTSPCLVTSLTHQRSPSKNPPSSFKIGEDVLPLAVQAQQRSPSKTRLKLGEAVHHSSPSKSTRNSTKVAECVDKPKGPANLPPPTWGLPTNAGAVNPFMDESLTAAFQREVDAAAGEEAIGEEEVERLLRAGQQADKQATLGPFAGFSKILEAPLLKEAGADSLQMLEFQMDGLMVQVDAPQLKFSLSPRPEACAGLDSEELVDSLSVRIESPEMKFTLLPANDIQDVASKFGLSNKDTASNFQSRLPPESEGHAKEWEKYILELDRARQADRKQAPKPGGAGMQGSMQDFFRSSSTKTECHAAQDHQSSAHLFFNDGAITETTPAARLAERIHAGYTGEDNNAPKSSKLGRAKPSILTSTAEHFSAAISATAEKFASTATGLERKEVFMQAEMSGSFYSTALVTASHGWRAADGSKMPPLQQRKAPKVCKAKWHVVPDQSTSLPHIPGVPGSPTSDEDSPLMTLEAVRLQRRQMANLIKSPSQATLPQLVKLPRKPWENRPRRPYCPFDGGSVLKVTQSMPCLREESSKSTSDYAEKLGTSDERRNLSTEALAGTVPNAKAKNFIALNEKHHRTKIVKNVQAKPQGLPPPEQGVSHIRRERVRAYDSRKAARSEAKNVS